MKILICMASIDPSRGGPTTAVHALASALVSTGHQVTITAHDDRRSSAVGDTSDMPYEVHRFRLSLRTWQYSREYSRWIKRNVSEYDAIIVNSLFLAHTFSVCRNARKKGIPYALRPHGSLNEADMANKKFAKKLYIRLIEKINLSRAKYIFCTSDAEALQLARLGYSNAITIPLGVNPTFTALERQNRLIARRSVLYIGRISKKKNIQIIISAIARLKAEGENFTATIAGPDDEGLMPDLSNMAEEMGVSGSIEFRGFIGQQEQLALQSTAGCFALPSDDENFGIAVAEAMATGLPALITTGVSHSSHFDDYPAGVLVERSAESLSQAMLHVANLDGGDYQKMCGEAKRLVRDHYDWHRTAELVVQGFTRLDYAEPPAGEGGPDDV